jgi:hypothetical protein
VEIGRLMNLQHSTELSAKKPSACGKPLGRLIDLIGIIRQHTVIDLGMGVVGRYFHIGNRDEPDAGILHLKTKEL